jgi:hypothetical protein
VDSGAAHYSIHGWWLGGELTVQRFRLRDDQWDRIKDILPGREGTVGVTAAG